MPLAVLMEEPCVVSLEEEAAASVEEPTGGEDTMHGARETEATPLLVANIGPGAELEAVSTEEVHDGSQPLKQPSVGAAIANCSRQEEGALTVPNNQLVVAGQVMARVGQQAPATTSLSRRLVGLDLFGYDSDISWIKEVWLEVRA